MHAVPHPALPEVARSWPWPRGDKTRPLRWVGDALSYTELFERAIDEGGEDALAVIFNDRPRKPGSPLTVWFSRGVPMHVLGESQVDELGVTWHAYLVPARAALCALEEGRVQFISQSQQAEHAPLPAGPGLPLEVSA